MEKNKKKIKVGGERMAGRSAEAKEKWKKINVIVKVKEKEECVY